MNYNLYIILFFFLGIQLGYSQTPISGTINNYVKVTNVPSCNPCDNSCNTITVASTTGFIVGDRVMILQVKGATSSTIADPTFGSVSNYNQAGAFELNTISSITGLNITMASALKYPYEVSGLVQLIRVPVYPSAVVSAMVTGQSWNGNTGGVIVMEVTGSLTLNASINANGIGFRGGVSTSNGFSYPCGLTDYYYSDPTYDNAAPKGEGISEIATGFELGKGAWANGGGGGNSHNGGGGGGGNGGKGGKGGNDYCSGTVQSGGIGGNKLSTFNKNVYLGGSGGAGHQNNNTGTNGGNGGGIIIIIAGSIIGNNQLITSNGISALNTTGGGNDGAGGGGAGGTILLDIPSFSGLLQLTATGGKGGDMTHAPGGHAPGGGGAGGVIATTGTSLPGGVSTSLVGGLNGIITANASPFGAVAGEPGVILPNFMINSMAGPKKLFANLGSDVTLCDPITTNLTSGQTDPSYGYQWTYNGTVQSNNLPNYVVSAPGIYTVTISSPGCLDGKDTITIFTQAAAPIDAEFCAPPPQAVPLAVVGSGKYKWWSSPSGGTALANGNSYTPTLSTTTTFYVEDTSSFKYGDFTPKVMLTGFTTRNGGSNTYMSFNVSRPFTLDSVTMFIRTYDLNTSTMVINLRQKGNPTPLATKSLLVTGPCNCLVDREVQFNLGFNLTVGNDYYLEYASGAVSVHWDNFNASYPYTVPGVVSIVQPVDGSGNYIGWASTSYGFFYNWKISSGTQCLRVPVKATLNCSLPIEFISMDAKCVDGFPSFTATILTNDVGKAILEYSEETNTVIEEKSSEIDLKPGMNVLNFQGQNNVPVSPKYYRVKSTIEKLVSTSRWVVSPCLASNITLSPNPFNEDFIISSSVSDEIIYSVYTTNGKLYLEGKSKTPFKLGEQLLPGIYFIKIIFDDQLMVQKIVKY